MTYLINSNSFLRGSITVLRLVMGVKGFFVDLFEKITFTHVVSTETVLSTKINGTSVDIAGLESASKLV
jgi:hypothetical protein